ncbi:MAG: bifunctional (p)ppGpp synthetase/guanosine-3',5'-bis(diphosphate) 3'-pyrophosphohydrolase [Bacteroidetes bacterium]|nr:bifunctional (p)ppGpp synthetase/guanosine-3',5'-bis(diphosphate) 3'-pyrophosphohydrolase [Bacteroidota bacterium]NBY30064.1 bifunctional (p)ppGpp synthetase/guanosine-3',5'-bis(diphosphate) 3'-pyrophosphohydrolase [Sphingobacteriia bacterium]
MVENNPSSLVAWSLSAEEEVKEISKRYRSLLKTCRPFLDKGNRKLIRRAFELAVDAHKDMRRKSGEPYIFHPIEVARITAEDIGLGTTAVVAALLHDTVEDTDLTLAEIENEFGNIVARIIEGLTKISGLYNKSSDSSQQLENFRKMLLTLADDIRVILIKLADRLHNMRTLDNMPQDKQLKIAHETSYLFAPLAHRLGLYNIKSELEDLALKYIEPGIYRNIARKLQETKVRRDRYIREFIVPLQQKIESAGLKAEIKGRPKSISSIWNKMKKQNIDFEEVYDLFAIRIILDSPLPLEKTDCWRVYALITDQYQPNPNRLRDWISTPKINGYESLHTTVMGPEGKWVEIQIRSQRMNQVAEKGLAAHWKYKDQDGDPALDAWINKVREMLESPQPNTMEFMDEFKLQLYSKEIFVFTPKGKLLKMSAGSTALDMAFEIHSELGLKCIGAKVNHKLVPLSYVLRNGDQVEILSSNIQRPNPDWLQFLGTAKAKNRVRQSLKEQRREITEAGRVKFLQKLKGLTPDVNDDLLQRIVHHLGHLSLQDLYYDAEMGKIDWNQVQNALRPRSKRSASKELASLNSTEALQSGKAPRQNSKDSNFEETEYGNQPVWVDGKQTDFRYRLASCCNPIPGDEIVGIPEPGKEMVIHRQNCVNSAITHSTSHQLAVRTRWNKGSKVAFLTGIFLKGTDDKGIISGITQVITDEMHLNMRSITVVSEDGMFEGRIMVYLDDTKALQDLMLRLRKVRGVLKVGRIEKMEPSLKFGL